MLSYKELQNKPRILQSLTGLSLPEFEQLLGSFEQAWQDYLNQHYKKRDSRVRRYGGGRKAELHETQDKLLFILFYFRQYPTQEVQGYLFGIGQAQAHEWIHRLTGVLNQALGKKGTTVKNNIISERIRGGKVKYLSQTVAGKKHDKKLADEEGYQFPTGSSLWQDTGFQGYAPEGVTIALAIK